MGFNIDEAAQLFILLIFLAAISFLFVLTISALLAGENPLSRIELPGSKKVKVLEGEISRLRREIYIQRECFLLEQ